MTGLIVACILALGFPALIAVTAAYGAWTALRKLASRRRIAQAMRDWGVS